MSIQAVAWALGQNIPNAPLKLVLISLCNHADKETGECWPSLGTISKEASMSKRSVQRHVAGLADMGVIELSRTFSANGRQSANTYRVIFEPVERERIASYTKNRGGGCQIDTLGADDMQPEDVRRFPVDNLCITPSEGCQIVMGEGDTVVTPLCNKPSEEPLEKKARAGAKPIATFDKLLGNWTSANQPDNRSGLYRLFSELTARDARLAVDLAPTYCRLKVRRREKPDALSYLRDFHYLDLDGAPDFDKNGDFIITPDRPEWEEWKAHFAKFEAKNVLRAFAGQHILRQSRWPVGHTKGSK